MITQKELGSCLEFITHHGDFIKLEITNGEVTVFYRDVNGETTHSHFGFGSHLEIPEYSKEESWKIGIKLATQFFSAEPE